MYTVRTCLTANNCPQLTRFNQGTYTHVLSAINEAILQLFLKGFCVMSEHLATLNWTTLLLLRASVVIKYTQ